MATDSDSGASLTAERDELIALVGACRSFLSQASDSGARFVPDGPSVPAHIFAHVASHRGLAVDPQVLGDVGARPSLAVLRDQAAACTSCGLHEGRTQSVFSRGSEQAELVFVGEGPGYHEDQQGEPFVGDAGKLLDKMIVAMGYARDEVYICNVVKCRPPQNRTPEKDEASACSPFLHGQLRVLRPKAIVALGRCAAESLGVLSAKSWRGTWGTLGNVFADEGDAQLAQIPVMPTYHPAFLLRSPEMKRVVWEDLQKVMARLRG